MANDDTNHEFPTVFRKRDWARLFQKSERTIDRYYRAGSLPEPLPIPGPPTWAGVTARRWYEGEGTKRRGRR